eukprot:m.78740 g.78740  ORF g.78740 m.78740 type:complete len:374 (+) comp12543_c0_seq4:125-1246(+)
MAEAADAVAAVVQGTELELKVLALAELGDVDAMQAALKEDRSACSFQEPEDGQSPLMVAAGNGHLDVVQLLLENGAPWNAVDRRGKCAGQYAMENGHQDIANHLLNAGVQAELLFAVLERKSKEGSKLATALNQEYLERGVMYEGVDLVDDKQRGVMMEWEKPLMEMHAELVTRAKGDVLNVGFGLGLVDTAIQSHNPRSHTIIEAHPTVYKRMLADGWDKKPNVQIYHGRWQDVLPTLGQFDGIFFDTFDDVVHMHEFHQYLPQHLRKGGVYTYFNGVCSENVFFQAVACQVLQTLLEQLEMTTVFQTVQVDWVSEETWKDVKYKYFEDQAYYFPVVWWQDSPPAFMLEASEPQEQQEEQAQGEPTNGACEQ